MKKKINDKQPPARRPAFGKLLVGPGGGWAEESLDRFIKRLRALQQYRQFIARHLGPSKLRDVNLCGRCHKSENVGQDHVFEDAGTLRCGEQELLALRFVQPDLIPPRGVSHVWQLVPR